jgi:hypothetical protein
MAKSPQVPTFASFLHWLAQRESQIGAAPRSDHYASALAVARDARDATLAAPGLMQSNDIGTRPGYLEVLQLLAAAATEDPASRPPELTTARGFRVTLSYDDGANAGDSTICVLVRCPPGRVDQVSGQTAYLWNGSERFELGQFDAEGKAIGTLPAGIEITLSDFTQGRVKLEEPPEGD